MHKFPDLRDSHERTAIMSASDFDPGNMTTSSTPPQGSKKKSWDDGDDSSVTCVNFSKRPKFQKSTHPDSFPADKNKFSPPGKMPALRYSEPRSELVPST